MSDATPVFHPPFGDDAHKADAAAAAATAEGLAAESSHSPKPPAMKHRDRRMTIYQSREGRPRWVLHMQAVFWRVLMNLGMFFHRLAPPRPPKPNFSRVIASTLATRPGSIPLHFYVPRDYETQRRLWTVRDGGDDERSLNEEEELNKRRSKRLSAVAASVGDTIRRHSLNINKRKWGGYPVIINFHGGGFTLGTAMDDARWCGTVVDECNAVVVSVDYRLAPECPFPTAVEDGVDAVIYIHQHAEELGIDPDKIGLSGFSSGGNMAFTVPLRLYDEIAGFPRDDTSLYRTASRADHNNNSSSTAALIHARPQSPVSTDSAFTNATTAVAGGQQSRDNLLDPHAPPASSSSSSRLPKSQTFENITEVTESTPEDYADQPLPRIPIRCIVPWYPSVDYTRTREQRRATCVRKDQELPALFTDLFDESYLHPPHNIALDSPYLSPGVAPTRLLREALPQEIILHTCEWDMLLDEGQAFRDRLVSEEIGKEVAYFMVPGVPHGWDKAPNPWKPTPGVREHYLRACREIRRIMGPSTMPGARPVVERESSAGPSAAPRESVALVR